MMRNLLRKSSEGLHTILVVCGTNNIYDKYDMKYDLMFDLY